MTAAGKRLIRAAEEMNAIAKGEADPSTYRMHVPADTAPSPWGKRKPAATSTAKKRKRPSAPSAGLPEWLLQAYMVAEFNKLEAEGWELSAVADMNAGKRGRWAASQAKAMGMVAGEPDLRIYGYPARILFVEVKTTTGKKSRNQDLRHDRLAALGHTVLMVAPRDEAHARSIAREIATKFCDSPQGWGGL